MVRDALGGGCSKSYPSLNWKNRQTGKQVEGPSMSCVIVWQVKHVCHWDRRLHIGRYMPSMIDG